MGDGRHEPGQLPGPAYVLVAGGEVVACQFHPERLLGDARALRAAGDRRELRVLPLDTWQDLVRAAERVHRWNLMRMARQFGTDADAGA